MNRAEAVALVKELGERELIRPTFVIIHQAESNRFSVKMKGDYDWKEIESFLKNRGFLFESHEDFLIIS